MRKSRKPRIQYVYAAWCACWIADALTMKRTIATKMIVMSNELRTRGSMPGAIRSEIITRSSAWEAITTSTVGAIPAIVALEPWAAQEQRELAQEVEENGGGRIRTSVG